ncbi:MAG: hypothetical protein KAJ29_06355 [Alphaproteobacteria bacterium]|nr:hypothetical protein [Alphaproteobacteria bacterium]
MSSTKLVTSVLLVCALVGFYFAHSIVRANEPELYFYPEKKWSVKRLNPDDDSLPVCTISNQLNNGYIVEMSGNTEGFNAINIDFRQKAFQQGMAYEVRYLVPGISRIIIPSKAVEKSKIASDLTGHLDFAKEMSNAGVMDIQIRDNSFRLYLTGLKAKMPLYNECTGVSNKNIAHNNSNALSIPSDDLLQSSSDVSAEYVPAQPKTVAGVAPPPPAVPTPVENAPDAMAMDSASRALPDISDEPRYIDILAAKLKRGSKGLTPVDDTKDSNNKRDSANNADNAPSVSPSENTDNSSGASSADSSAVNTSKDNEAAVSERRVRRENVKSPKMVQTITKNEKPIVIDFTDNVKSPAESPKERHASANDMMAARMSQIEPASNTASGQAVNMDAIASNDEEFVDMRNKISSLEHQVMVLSDKNVMLDEELEIALKDAEKERMSVSSDNWNLERATMRFNEAERQIQRLGRQMQTQRAQCDIEKTELENMLFDPKVTSQHQLAKLSSMEVDLDQAKAETLRQRRQYEERIRLLEQRLGAQ